MNYLNINNLNNWFKDILQGNDNIETLVNDKYVKKGSANPALYKK